MKTGKLLAVGLSCILLQGCLAAAAIPIVASGGAIVRDGVSDDARAKRDDPQGEESVAVVPSGVAASAEANPDTAADTGSTVGAEASEGASAEPELAAAKPSDPVGTGTLVSRTITPLPEPEALASQGFGEATTPPLPAARDAGQYQSLLDYAQDTLEGGVPLMSAMLADPASLEPTRRFCQGDNPTVVIDLDPAGGVVDLSGPIGANSELARALAHLRQRDIEIAWITDRGPTDARALRDRLAASGLDPDETDTLYVERYPGETKQARRTALAETQCVIALAGDERSDFDELYTYLIDEDDARELDALLGNGWFLIENPVGG